ncbi:MAG TPA: hypothetical protein VFT51_11495 [Bacillales bacterium]|nr:hypothetical protein [Bacillales bacterium]
MKKMYVVVMILFFVMVGCVLYLSVTHQNRPVVGKPGSQQEINAFGLLDSEANGV